MHASLAPDDVQLFPVKVASESEPYFLVNVTRAVRCIDDSASEEVRYWKPEQAPTPALSRHGISVPTVAVLRSQ